MLNLPYVANRWPVLEFFLGRYCLSCIGNSPDRLSTQSIEMPRKKDRFCEYVTFLDDKGSKWKCTFCDEEFSGGGTRIKAHLANAERYGIKKCGAVNNQVRKQAWEALCGKRVQDPDGADKRSISPHHHSMNTAVPDYAHQPMNHQPTSSEDCIALLYRCPNETSGAEVVEVQPQAQMYDGSRTHQGLGQRPPNVQQTNIEFQVPQVKMCRKRDIDFCQYVKTFEDEKRTKRMCTFCDHEFAGGSTRIKAHLAKAKGHGIVECEKVSEEVRVRAWNALCGKQMQGRDGAGNENISQHHHPMNNTVHEDVYRPINQQSALIQESSQITCNNLPSTHQGLGNIRQINTQFEVPHGSSNDLPSTHQAAAHGSPPPPNIEEEKAAADEEEEEEDDRIILERHVEGIVRDVATFLEGLDIEQDKVMGIIQQFKGKLVEIKDDYLDRQEVEGIERDRNLPLDTYVEGIEQDFNRTVVATFLVGSDIEPDKVAELIHLNRQEMEHMERDSLRDGILKIFYGHEFDVAASQDA